MLDRRRGDPAADPAGGVEPQRLVEVAADLPSVEGSGAVGEVPQRPGHRVGRGVVAGREGDPDLIDAARDVA